MLFGCAAISAAEFRVCIIGNVIPMQTACGKSRMLEALILAVHY